MMRKTLGSYYCRYFKMPLLFQEELHAIEQIIEKDLKTESYCIATGWFEYKNLDDIPEAATPTNALVIYTHNPCLRLKLARSWAELQAGDDGRKIEHGIHKIADIVSGS